MFSDVTGISFSRHDITVELYNRYAPNENASHDTLRRLEKYISSLFLLLFFFNVAIK